MKTEWKESPLVEQTVTYTVVIDGTIWVIDHVPARVNMETGEQFFSPDTVERILHIINTRTTPDRIIETPVFEFAA